MTLRRRKGFSNVWRQTCFNAGCVFGRGPPDVHSGVPGGIPACRLSPPACHHPAALTTLLLPYPATLPPPPPPTHPPGRARAGTDQFVVLLARWRLATFPSTTPSHNTSALYHLPVLPYDHYNLHLPPAFHTTISATCQPPPGQRYHGFIWLTFSMTGRLWTEPLPEPSHRTLRHAVLPARALRGVAEAHAPPPPRVLLPEGHLCGRAATRGKHAGRFCGTGETELYKRYHLFFLCWRRGTTKTARLCLLLHTYRWRDLCSGLLRAETSLTHAYGIRMAALLTSVYQLSLSGHALTRGQYDGD